GPGSARRRIRRAHLFLPAKPATLPPLMKPAVCFFFVLVLSVSPAFAGSLADQYLDRYYTFYPTRATAAGRHDLDTRLEGLSPQRRKDWEDFNRKEAETFQKRLADPRTDPEERLDDELLLRQARLEVLDFATEKRPERDPLFWTGLLGNATVFLL